ncbi:hypothetical protein [Dongshaea marina]|uniref:hypothetical protein n=1 Tax=Dongshaea marina TaxID=2047966 RepID=UPI000D3EC54B|nr:hypothetical protein [Dongshaea marina]
MIRKWLRWVLLLILVGLIFSQVKLDTSIYKTDENQLEISFPRWQKQYPWIYLKWSPDEKQKTKFWIRLPFQAPRKVESLKKY